MTVDGVPTCSGGWPRSSSVIPTPPHRWDLRHVACARAQMQHTLASLGPKDFHSSGGRWPTHADLAMGLTYTVLLAFEICESLVLSCGLPAPPLCSTRKGGRLPPASAQLHREGGERQHMA